MEPGAGVAAAAAARVFGHPKAGSSRIRNRRPVAARKRTRSPSRPLQSKQSPMQLRPLPLHSLCRASRSRSTAARALPGRPHLRYRRAPKANGILAKPSTLIETPMEWNGAGLLPGESISRYRGSASETPAAAGS